MDNKTESDSFDASLDKLGSHQSVVEVDGDKPLERPVEMPEFSKRASKLYTDVVEPMPELMQSADARDKAPAFESVVEGAKSAQPNDSGHKAESWTRRNLLKAFSTGGLMAAASGCVFRPEEKAISYVDHPMDSAIGNADYFSSTCGECSTGCGVEVKTFQGRPSKIEGSKDHPVSDGGSCSLGQSTLQTLYNPQRRRKAVIRRGRRIDPATFIEAYEHLGARLKGSKNIGILARGLTGSSLQLYKDFLVSVGSSVNNLFLYDADSRGYAEARAHQLTFGRYATPSINFKNARQIVGISAEFLDTGASPATVRNFSDAHRLDPQHPETYATFTQFESRLSNTGAKADKRKVIAPGSELWVAATLLEEILKLRASTQGSQVLARLKGQLAQQKAGFKTSLPYLKKLAKKMISSPSVVVAGSSASDDNSENLQLVIVAINRVVQAYSNGVLDFQRKIKIPAAPYADLRRLKQSGANLDALIVIDANPAFDLPASWGWKGLAKEIGTVVSMQVMANETDAYADYQMPNTHYLESWGDANPVRGLWSFRQPAVKSITGARQAEDSLMWIAAAMGKPLGHKNFHKYLEASWKNRYVSGGGSAAGFRKFLHGVQKKGFWEYAPKDLGLGAKPVAGEIIPARSAAKEGLVLTAPLDGRLLDGRGSDRPVLQEVGDGLTTIAWDSWLAINPDTAKKMGLKQYEEVEVSAVHGSVKVGVFPFPGLHPSQVILNRGNGRTFKGEGTSNGVGSDPLELVHNFLASGSGLAQTANIPVKLKKTGGYVRLAHQQKGLHSLGDKTDIIKKQTKAEMVARSQKGIVTDLDTAPDLYPALKVGRFRWGMTIDLSSCSGCSACMVACSVENNVPQVGQREVAMGRQMHWIRIDRYFEGETLEPQVSFQPMLCQHCNHAPCEAVCPVYATTHDDEGLNVQTYNRCVGTRYCANGCPYKVRRFNWFTYKWNTKMNPRATNPYVTVRQRGVMEKCTMCVQRIRDEKHSLLKRGKKLTGKERLEDGKLQTACQQACSTGAIKFGDLLNEKSEASIARKDPRTYAALNGDPEHGHYGIKTQPNVTYMAQLVDHKIGGHHGEEHGSGHGKDDHGEKPHGSSHGSSHKPAHEPAHDSSDSKGDHP